MSESTVSPIYQTMETSDDQNEMTKHLWMDVPQAVYEDLRKREDIRSRIVYSSPHILTVAQAAEVTALIAAVEEVCSWDWSAGDSCKEALQDMHRLQEAYAALAASQPSPAATAETKSAPVFKATQQAESDPAVTPDCAGAGTQCSAGNAREEVARKLAAYDGNRFEGKYGIIIAEHDKEIYRKRADEVLGLAASLLAAQPQTAWKTEPPNGPSRCIHPDGCTFKKPERAGTHCRGLAANAATKIIAARAQLNAEPDECPKCGATSDDVCEFEFQCWLDNPPHIVELLITELRQQVANGEDIANEDAKVLLRRYDQLKRKQSNVV